MRTVILLAFMEEAFISSPANPAPASDDETPFVEVVEHCETVLLHYKPHAMIQYVEGVPRTIPMTRWSYEEVLKYLTESTKTRLEFFAVSTPEHLEHSEKIRRTCSQFKYVGITNWPCPLNQQIYNWLKKKSIEKEKNNIVVHFTSEIADNVSQVYIDVERNGVNTVCEIYDPENIAYPNLVDYLKEVSNKSNMVSIILDGAEFKDLFGELRWQYEGVMEENLSNGVDTTIRVMDDNNIYDLGYCDPVERSLQNAQYESEESVSEVSIQG